MKSGRIQEIDGLRAIAMTMVIAQHCWLMPFGWVGVWLFFVISGYVITLSLLSDESGTAGQRYRQFVVRRFYRIVPLYLLYLSIVVGIVLASGQTSVLNNLPSLLTFTYNWQMIYSLVPAGDFGPIGHLWTLSIEEQFYIFFPLLFLLLDRRHFLKACLGLLIAGPFIRLFTSLSSQTVSDEPGWLAFSVYANSFCHFDAFIAGAVLAVLRREVQQNRAILRVLWPIAIGAGGLFCVAYVLLNARNGETGVNLLRNIISGNMYGEGREVFVYTVTTLLAVALIASCILRHPLTRFLAWGPLVYVGKVSYGGYVYHALVLYVIESVSDLGSETAPVWQRLLTFAIVWPITLAAAGLSYRYFESRFMAPRVRLAPAGSPS